MAESSAPATSQQPLVTIEDLPSLHIDGPYELVDGRIVRMSPAGMGHGLVVGRINMLVTAHVARHALGLVTSGEAGYVTRRGPDRVRAPDLAFLSHGTLAAARATSGTFFPAAPDLAIEVLSPDDAWQAVEEKVRDYLRAGARAVWVASPAAEQVYVYRQGEPGAVLRLEDQLQGGDVLPGFSCQVRAFFRDA